MHEAIQITVPGQVGTTDLPYASELSPWLSPLQGLLQSATAQATSELMNVVTSVGLVYAPNLMVLVGGFRSVVDLDPLEPKLRRALRSVQSPAAGGAAVPAA